MSLPSEDWSTTFLHAYEYIERNIERRICVNCGRQISVNSDDFVFAVYFSPWIGTTGYGHHFIPVCFERCKGKLPENFVDFNKEGWGWRKILPGQKTGIDGGYDLRDSEED